MFLKVLFRLDAVPCLQENIFVSEEIILDNKHPGSVLSEVEI